MSAPPTRLAASLKGLTATVLELLQLRLEIEYEFAVLQAQANLFLQTQPFLHGQLHARIEEAQRLAGPDPVARVCRQVKDQGCAIVIDTLLRGISAVAAPIFDARGRVVAVLTALGASNGFDARPGGKVCPQVMHEAAIISHAMGFGPG